MYRTRRIIAVIALLVSLAALVACSSGGTGRGTTGSGNTITLQNTQFNPSSLTVNSGDTVTIENKDTVPHHVVIGTDDLGEQAVGETKTWTAPGDAVYLMKCLIHPSMSGQITVGAGGNTVGTSSSGGSGSGY